MRNIVVLVIFSILTSSAVAAMAESCQVDLIGPWQVAGVDVLDYTARLTFTAQNYWIDSRISLMLRSAHQIAHG